MFSGDKEHRRLLVFTNTKTSIPITGIMYLGPAELVGQPW